MVDDERYPCYFKEKDFKIMLVMNNEESKSLFLQKFKDIGCHKAIGLHHSCCIHSGC